MPSRAARLTVLMGPPASGKSTYAASLTGCKVVSVDEFREAVGLSPGTGNLAAFTAAYRATSYWLARGQHVVFDSTAITPTVRRQLRKTAHRLGVPCHLVVVHAEPRTCRARNTSRPAPVPADRMDSMLREYQREYAVAVGAENWTTTRVVDGQVPIERTAGHSKDTA